MSRLCADGGLPAVALVAGGRRARDPARQRGGTFEPLRPADPCVARTVTSQSDGIDGLTERLVLLGIDGAACRLGVSREALTLELAQTGDPTDAAGRRPARGPAGRRRRMKDDGIAAAGLGAGRRGPRRPPTSTASSRP